MELVAVDPPEQDPAAVDGQRLPTPIAGPTLIAGPALALYAFSYSTTSHVGSAVACVAGLIVTWAITR